MRQELIDKIGDEVSVEMAILLAEKVGGLPKVKATIDMTRLMLFAHAHIVDAVVNGKCPVDYRGIVEAAWADYEAEAVARALRN